MADLDPAKSELRGRFWALFMSRLRELVDPRTTVSRRARTLNIRTASIETAGLARAYLRAAGVTRPAAAPSVAGHGVATLPDVAEEALCLLTDDVVLKERQKALVEPLRRVLEAVKNAGSGLLDRQVAQLEALNWVLERTYLVDAFDMIALLAEYKPNHLEALERTLSTLVSDLRSRGWTDETLQQHFCDPALEVDVPAGFRKLRAALVIEPEPFQCAVAVTVGPILSQLKDAASPITLLDNVDDAPPGIPSKGPFINVEVFARDHRFAARVAHGRVSSVLGAVAVFTSDKVSVRSPSVLVQRGTEAWAVPVKPPVPTERRETTEGQVMRIISSTLALASREDGSDAVFDAIRHRHRALETDDQESRFMLLWIGIERLVVGTRDHTKVLEAARTLIPRAIALGKIRRDFSALASALNQLELEESDKSRLRDLVGPGPTAQPVDRVKLISAALGEEEFFRKVIGSFRDASPLLAQWYWGLRKSLGQGKGTDIAAYIDGSRRRGEWQILRLYRARNSLAHTARAPFWLGDLIAHANFYLTQIVAIAIHYRETDPSRSASDILVSRAGQFDTFVDLLRQEHGQALLPETLLRPTSMVAGRQ